MSGIAGIAESGGRPQVLKMLEKISHRGLAGREAIEFDGGTLGIVWGRTGAHVCKELREHHCARDQAGDGHLAEARVKDGRVLLTRDQLGVAPLYWGRTEDGKLCFASEVKALLEMTREIHEFPQGHSYDGDRMQPYFRLQKRASLDEPIQQIAKELRDRLGASVRKRINEDQVGAWLSGGLDSSTMATLARASVSKLYTFAAGLQGAPDLEYARETADFIGSDHREAIVDFGGLLEALPEVIYHLESFDALLIRSSITNFLVAQLASRHVPEVFSGEGGDELFAGYDYLKSLSLSDLPDELIDITGRLHNTALQRVDRCASAHGTVAHVPFTDPDVLDYALRVPAELKLRDGVEKWILRQAMTDALPERVLKRTKSKFWEGAGVGSLLAMHADREISDDEFRRERELPNGWNLDTKEELMYFRIFKERFGELADLSWMGRTKSGPKQ